MTSCLFSVQYSWQDMFALCDLFFFLLVQCVFEISLIVVFVLCYSEKSQAPRTSRWELLYSQQFYFVWSFTACLQSGHTARSSSLNLRTGSHRSFGQSLLYSMSCVNVNVVLKKLQLFGNVPHALIFYCRSISQILASHRKARVDLALHKPMSFPTRLCTSELRSVAAKSKSPPPPKQIPPVFSLTPSFL